MPKITYQEFRPGKWVKLVDGKIVGPAATAEVEAWKEERAAPVRIWEDVVKVTKPPTVKPAAPTARKEPEQSTIWDDIVKRAKPAVKAEGPLPRPERSEGPPAPRPRKEDTDWAEQTQIWQDVVGRIKRPERELDRGLTAEAKAKPEDKAPPARQAASQPTPPIRPAPETGTRPAVGAPAPLKDATTRGTMSPSVERGSITQPAPPARLAPTPTASARTLAKEEAVGAAPARPATARPPPAAEPPAKTAVKEVASGAAPVKPAAVKPAPAAKPLAKTAAREAASGATPVKPGTAKPAKKAQAAVKVTTAKKAAAARAERPKPIKDAKPPAEPVIPDEESAPAETVEEPLEPAHARNVAPRSGTATGAASSRHTTKAKPSAAQDRPNPLYLWIIAAPSDDLPATVRTGLARYQERFSQPAEVVLCHSGDLPALEAAKLPVDLREGKGLAPRNFWIGLK